MRYVGEPVAAVFAEDPYLAEDAADLVDIRVEELPVLLTAEDSPCEFAPGHRAEADVIRKGYGDVDAAFARRTRSSSSSSRSGAIPAPHWRRAPRSRGTIQRATSWSRSPRCASAVRSNGSRTGAST
jgi:hypothetical protein